MGSLWNGSIYKHRDYLHPDFYTHAVANGGGIREITDEFVMLDFDPVSLEPLIEEQKYYGAWFSLHAGDAPYLFLVNATASGGKPGVLAAARDIKAYFKDTSNWTERSELLKEIIKEFDLTPR